MSQREPADLDLDFGAEQLVDRGLGAERLAAQLLGEKAQAVEPHRLDLRLEAREALTQMPDLRSPRRPFTRARRARSFRSSRLCCSDLTSAIELRSCASAVLVTSQPCPSSPSRFSTGTRTLSKNTSANGVPPFMFLIGLHGDAGGLHRDEQAGDAACASPPAKSVRTSRMIHCAHIASEVQIFWPLTTYSSPSRTALHWSDARSLPEPGSE